MKMNTWFTGVITSLFLSLIIITGCNKDPLPDASRDSGQPIEIPKNGLNVVDAQNQYSFKLFKDNLKSFSGASNILVSPLSIYLDLSMVYNGAEGSTQSGMAKALQLKDTTRTILNKTNKSLITGLPQVDPKVKINIANSIWYRKQGAQPLAPFLKTISSDYQAQVTGADFGNQETVGLINNWVASNTQQKIKSIIDKINPDDMMYLINAVYFNGKWKYEFDPDKTKKRTFYTASGEGVKTDFMTQEGTFKYMKNEGLSVIELPYGNGSFNMYLFLPGTKKTISRDFVSSLNNEKFERFIGKLDSGTVKLRLPKWKYHYDIPNLKPVLSRMGMSVAFQPGQANFSDMYPSEANAYISKVVHKTYIKVDEEGTEAAAVTSTGMTTTSTTTGPDPIPVIDVNHPFLYVITEKQTGAVLFLGIVNNPEEHSNKSAD